MSRYMFDAVHNTVRRVADDDDDKRVIRDGERVRVSMTMMDAAQRAVARNAPAHDGVVLIDRQELADWDKAQLSARWRGGLQDGDRVRVGRRDLVVAGRDPASGRFTLRDAATSAQDAETARQSAYAAYDSDISTRYLNSRDADAVAGDACVVGGRSGTWRERDGRLVCVVGGGEPGDNEWAVAGPLSDHDPLSDAERIAIKDAAYADYDERISNAWRR